MSIVFCVALTLLVSYLLGCFNGAVMTSHFVIKDDVRKHGSGNAGLTNFYRTYGAKYALGVIALDMGKTVVACLIGGFLFQLASEAKSRYCMPYYLCCFPMAAAGVAALAERLAKRRAGNRAQK